MNTESLLKDMGRVLNASIASLYRKADAEEREAAQADPLKNKLTLVMAAGANLNYRYWPAGNNGKGQTVRFCWAVHRNAAGFFLGWRETIRKNGTLKRDMLLSRRVKARCAEIAKSRAEAHKLQRHGKSAT